MWFSFSHIFVRTTHSAGSTTSWQTVVYSKPDFMERKDFLKKTFAMCGLALIPAGVIESCNKQTYSGPSNVNFTLDLTSAANAALNTSGGSVLINGLIVIRLNSSTFDAFSSTCTHAGCTVGYSGGSTLVCPCHGGTYSATTGSVISGPPPSALTKYTTTLSGNILTVKS